MKYLIVVFGLSIVALVVTGCAKQSGDARSTNVQEVRDVVCYSGGTVVYQGQAVGQVWRDGAGLVFTDKQTRKSVLTTADCVIGTEIPIVSR